MGSEATSLGMPRQKIHMGDAGESYFVIIISWWVFSTGREE